MRTRHLLLISFILASISCHKSPSPQPQPPENTVGVRLKDINFPHLPSPFYHFAYDNAGYITNASFSAELDIYDVVYANKRVLRMEAKGVANKDVLQYEYTGNDVVMIKIVNKQGVIYRRAFLRYTPSHQLQTIDWEIKMEGVGYAQEQTLQLNYYPDGNLNELVTHNYAVGSQTAAIFTDKFQDYDEKVNVDAFSLLHRDQLHHLILLPGIKIQKNNPRRSVRTGDASNYEVNYTYTYDAAGRPLVRTGDLLWTSGPDNGKHFGTQATFSYYD